MVLLYSVGILNVGRGITSEIAQRKQALFVYVGTLASEKRKSNFNRPITLPTNDVENRTNH